MIFRILRIANSKKMTAAGEPVRGIRQPAINDGESGGEGLMNGQKTTGKKRAADRVWLALRVVLLVLAGCIVLTSLLLVLQSVLPGDQMPGLLRPSAENTGVMAPAVCRGDFILLRSVGDGPEVGDVVSYRAAEQGTFALGRVVAEDESGYLVRGDAETPETGILVEKDRIRGIFTGFRIPFLGYPILFLQTVPGFITAVLVFLLMDVLLTVFLRRRRPDDGTAEQGTGFALCGLLLVDGGTKLVRRVRKQTTKDGGQGHEHDS